MLIVHADNLADKDDVRLPAALEVGEYLRHGGVVCPNIGCKVIRGKLVLIELFAKEGQACLPIGHARPEHNGGQSSIAVIVAALAEKKRG